MRIGMRLLPVLALAALACLGGCGSVAGDSTTSAPAETSTSAVSSTIVPATESTTTVAAETSTTESLPEGEREFAFVTELRTDPDGSITVVADYAQWLTGDEATKAAIEDGFLEEGESVPNDFYIRNENTRLRELTVQSDAPIVLVACYIDGDCVTTARVTTQQWMALYEGETVPELGAAFQWYGQSILPYWLTVDGDTVIAVEEQYLP